jgi:hypothetical protein
LIQLPAGNQVDALAAFYRDGLMAAELDGVVNLFLAAPGQKPEEHILAFPREALKQSREETGRAWDPRLS